MIYSLFSLNFKMLFVNLSISYAGNTYYFFFGKYKGDVTNGLCEHSRACRALLFFCEHEQK